ncbi:hypothetical protein HYH02_001209 [Chlamydomonas schloesseri]|uniref:Pherophorin domain-containing protein n=1 Tax=Chlamydomonas schloesseri TaxID=2026947 RepID=A0A835WVH4_9CHLO|nr:hypothetical protein HYH02_001209 [Chlamydomonas schloesseri]|eukprot:KAG2454174.1 hypothetical protein HYH02_001209 [Chlamydomonas schloesseri]
MPRALGAALALASLLLLVAAADSLSTDDNLKGAGELAPYPYSTSSGELRGEGSSRQLAAAAGSSARGALSTGSDGAAPAPPTAQCVSYSGGDRVQLLSANTGEVLGWASLRAAAPTFTAADDPLLPNVTAPGYSSQASGLAQRNATYSGVFRNPRMRFDISLLSGRFFAGASPSTSGGSSNVGDAAGVLSNGGGHAGVHQLTAAVRDPGAANLRAYTFTDQPSSCPIAEVHFAQEAALPCAATSAAVDVDLPALFGCSSGANGGQPFSMGLFLQLSVRTANSANRACAASSAPGWSWAFGQEAPAAELTSGEGGVAVEVAAAGGSADEGVEVRPECAFFEVIATCNPAACGDANPPPPSPEPRPPRPRHNMPVADGATRAPPPAAPPVPAPLAPPAAPPPAVSPPSPSPPSPSPAPRRAPVASGGARAPPMPPLPVVDLGDSTSPPPQYPPLSVADGPVAADVHAPPPLPTPSPAQPSPSPTSANGPTATTRSNPAAPSPSTPAITSSTPGPQSPAAASLQPPESPEVIITFMPPPPHRTTEGGGFGGGSTGTNTGGGFGGSRTATVSSNTDGTGSAAAATSGDSSSGGGTMKPMAIAGVAAGAAVAGVAVVGVAALVVSGKVAALFAAATGSSALAVITAGAGVTGASAAVAAGTAAPAVGFTTGGGASAAAATAAAGREGWYFAIGRRSTNDSEASSEADPHSTRVSMNGAYDDGAAAAAASSPGGASTATASSGHTACSGQEPVVAMLMASISLPLANDGRQELW